MCLFGSSSNNQTPKNVGYLGEPEEDTDVRDPDTDVRDPDANPGQPKKGYKG